MKLQELYLLCPMVLAKVCKWVNTPSTNSENRYEDKKDVVKCGATMGKGSHSHLCEDRLSKRYSWELRKTFTDVFCCVLDLYKTQSYLLMH